MFGVQVRSTPRFNPPPALGPGETLAVEKDILGTDVSIRPRLWGRGKPVTASAFNAVNAFQSAPGFGAGGNASDHIVERGGSVSIRPRLWGRGKPLRVIRTSSMRSFQSAPGFGAGGNNGIGLRR